MNLDQVNQSQQWISRFDLMQIGKPGLPCQLRGAQGWNPNPAVETLHFTRLDNHNLLRHREQSLQQIEHTDRFAHAAALSLIAGLFSVSLATPHVVLSTRMQTWISYFART